MNRILFTVLLILTVSGCKGQSTTQENFSGTWTYEHFSDKNPLLNTVFTLNLTQNGDSLVGRYCAVARNGNRIDCSNNENKKNIAGIIRKDTAYVHFNGFYDHDASGKAKLYFKNGQLIWKIYKSSGEIYAPTKAKLNRKKKTKVSN